jgi:iron complex transport system permease protein
VAGAARPRPHQGALALVGLTLLLVAALLLSLACGSHGCSAGDLWQAAFGKAQDDVQALASELIWRLRLPRAFTALAVGGLLALAGALLQVLLRNPLADPYVLGVSSGASLAAVAALWLGAGSWALTSAAWFGALVSTLALFVLGRRSLTALDLRSAGPASARLLLTGVMLAAAWTALISLALTLAPDAQLRGMLFWLIGEITGSEPWAPALTALIALLALALAQARSLNVLLLGDARAMSLGVAVPRLRVYVCALAAAATAFAVTTAGALGFVGLLVPHVMRRLVGNDQRLLLPACVLAGGAVVVLADLLARSVAAPTQLPVGAVMSLVGVPVFLWVLHHAGEQA